MLLQCTPHIYLKQIKSTANNSGAVTSQYYLGPVHSTATGDEAGSSLPAYLRASVQHPQRTLGVPHDDDDDDDEFNDPGVVESIECPVCGSPFSTSNLCYQHLRFEQDDAHHHYRHGYHM